MISNDEISKLIIIMSLLMGIYLFVFVQTFIWLFPAFLILSGLAIQRSLLKKEVKDKAHTTFQESGNIAFYGLFGFASLIVTAMFVPQIPQFARLEITGVDSLLFGAMMACGEETLFRGGIGNYILQYSKGAIFGSILAISAIFMLYHLKVYGDDATALLFVFSSSIVLTYIAVVTNRLAPSLIAHIGNNAFAYMPLGPSGVVSYLFQSNVLLLIVGITILAVIFITQKRRCQK